MKSGHVGCDESPGTFATWAYALLLMGVFAFCWMDVIPFGDELQQFPRALHTLEPAWLSNDLFVGAPQGDHWVFFNFLAGLFWLAGPTWGAITARVAIWALMACSLVSLGRTLNFKPFAVVLGTALFIAYDQARFGGETIVGEAIAKHLAFPLVLFALAGWIRGRFFFAAAMLGLATSVHVLVGIWAIAIILGLMFFDERMKERGWRTRLTTVAVCIACALPGLIPIMALVLGDYQRGTAEADQIFIQFRHPHHLSPASWPVRDYLHFAGIFALFVALSGMPAISSRLTRIRRFVWTITIVTVVALAVGLITRNALFLKLHPYRFAPPLTALIVALMLGQIFATLRVSILRWIGAAAVAALALWLAPRGAHHFVQHERRQPEVEFSRLEVLHWLKEFALPSATVLANPAWSDVQWESRHTSVVSFKLVPFESSRINDWYSRLTDLVGVTPWYKPGEFACNWINDAFHGLDIDRLLSIAGQLKADFALAPAPCADSVPISYSNNHFCVYPTGGLPVISKNYLVLRYDDYSPISPYEGPPRKIETEKRLFDLAARYDAKVSVGVIPFPFEKPQTKPLDPAVTQLTQSWLGDSSSPWVQLLRKSVEGGVVEPALHGFEHRKRTLPDHRPGEYRGEPIDWQRQTIRLGRDAMVNALQRPIRVFIPPWNAWDAETATALKELEFEWLSPDQHEASSAADVLNIAPQCTADPGVALAAMQNGKGAPPGTVLVLVVHPFDFEKDAAKGEEYFQGVEKVLAFVQSSPDWTSVGFTDLPDSPPLWNARFRAAVQSNHSLELLEDLPGLRWASAGSDTLFRPYYWYQDNLWRLRLPFLAVLTVSALAAAFAVGWLILRLRVTPALVWTGFVIVIVAALYLGVGAWQKTQRGYDVRGVRWLAIVAGGGTAIGFLYAALRRPRVDGEYQSANTEILANDRTDCTVLTA